MEKDKKSVGTRSSIQSNSSRVMRNQKGKVVSCDERQGKSIFYSVRIVDDKRNRINATAFEKLEVGKEYDYDLRISNSKNSDFPPGMTILDPLEAL